MGVDRGPTVRQLLRRCPDNSAAILALNKRAQEMGFLPLGRKQRNYVLVSDYEYVDNAIEYSVELFGEGM